MFAEENHTQFLCRSNPSATTNTENAWCIWTDARRSKSLLQLAAGLDRVPAKVQWDMLHVRILHPNTNQLLREHRRQKRGGYRIQGEDDPKNMPLSTAQLLSRVLCASRN